MALYYIGPMCIISNGGIDALYNQPMTLSLTLNYAGGLVLFEMALEK